MENKTTFTTRSGKTLNLRFASAWRMGKLQGLIDLEMIREGINEENLTPKLSAIIRDEEKLRRVFDVMVDAEITDEILDEFDVQDLVRLIVAFFLETRKGTLVFKNGQSSLLGSTSAVPAQRKLPEDSPLTSRSTTRETETGK